jgi:hypothetical protein
VLLICHLIFLVCCGIKQLTVYVNLINLAIIIVCVPLFTTASKQFLWVKARLFISNRLYLLRSYFLMIRFISDLFIFNDFS